MLKAPEVEAATKALFDHIDACKQCNEGEESDESLCSVGLGLYDLESKAISRTSTRIDLNKTPGGWIAKFADREGGGTGRTAQEALCNLADIIDKCMEDV
jgi:hypothetical protein